MALSDVIMALLSPNQAEAAGLSAAKAAVRVPTKPAAKSKARPTTPTKPSDVAGIGSMAELPGYVSAPSPYEAVGLPPIYQNIGEAITQGNATLADLIAKNPQLANDPRFTAQVKFSEQSMISPLALGAVSKLVQEAPLPGIKSMRNREEDMRNYIDLMKQKEAGMAKNEWMYSDLSPFANLLQNVTGTDIKYKAPVNPLDKATQTRLAFEKELSDLMERRGSIERQLMHEMLGQPTTVSQGYAQERQVRAPAGKRGPDNSKFIYKEMTGLDNAKKLHTALQQYSQMLASGAPYQVKSGKYNEIRGMLKNVDQMGGALTKQEAEISFDKLPHPLSPEVPLLTGTKSGRIDDIISTVTSGMDRKINSLRATYPNENPLIDKLSGQYGPAKIQTQAPAEKRAVQGGTGIDFNKYKGK